MNDKPAYLIPVVTLNLKDLITYLVNLAMEPLDVGEEAATLAARRVDWDFEDLRLGVIAYRTARRSRID